MIASIKKIVFPFILFCGFGAQAQNDKSLKAWLATDAGSRTAITNQAFAKKPLSKKEAAEAATLFLADAYNRQAPVLKKQWTDKLIVIDKDSLKFEYKIFGEKPKEGRSLYISMHGGGNAAPRVNDQQWQNQIKLYTPAEGVYVAPRAPTNTWNLWHESHIDTLFDQLILAAIVGEEVDPNKVYILGYSAGGDGVYQLAPRMADRWAAAAMMAGHPNETSPFGLRNIGFALHMGALDGAYNRNEIARRWGVVLDSLQKADVGGYQHQVQLHEGRPHWMNREDTVAVPWMATFKRNPIPNKIVWKQDDVHHLQFYWLAVPASAVQTGGEIIATYKGNEINIDKSYADTLMVRLNDKMMDLDKPVVLRYEGKEIFRGKVKRSVDVIDKTVSERNDPGLVFSAELMIVKGKLVTTDK